MYAFNLPIMKIGVELTHQNMTQQTKDNLRKSKSARVILYNVFVACLCFDVVIDFENNL